MWGRTGHPRWAALGPKSVNTDFSQGPFESTNSSTDLAIGGQGFFIVKKSGDQTDYYTRAGGFSLDKNGDLIDAAGAYVQGKAMIRQPHRLRRRRQHRDIPAAERTQADRDHGHGRQPGLQLGVGGSYSVTSYSGTASDVASVSAASNDYPATGTYTLTLGTTVTVGSTVEYNATLTLPSGEAVTLTLPSDDNVADVQGTRMSTGKTVDTGLNLTLGGLLTGDQTVFNVTGFNASSPTSTSNYSSSMTVYDSLGMAHVVTVYFCKTAYDSTSQASTWNWSAVPQSGDAVVSGGSGTMTFNANGVLTSGGNAQPIVFDFAGAQAGQTINLVMGSGSGKGPPRSIPPPRIPFTRARTATRPASSRASA